MNRNKKLLFFFIFIIGIISCERNKSYHIDTSFQRNFFDVLSLKNDIDSLNPLIELDTLGVDSFVFYLFHPNFMRPPYGFFTITKHSKQNLAIKGEVRENGIGMIYRYKFNFFINQNDTINLQLLFDLFEIYNKEVYPESYFSDVVKYIEESKFEVIIENKSTIIINDFSLNKNYICYFGPSYEIQNVHGENLVGVVLTCDNKQKMITFNKNKNNKWVINLIYNEGVKKIVNKPLSFKMINFID